MRCLDLAAARAAVKGDDEHRVLAALSKAQRGGSSAAFDDLITLGAASEATATRTWARQTLLDLLRIEGRWDRLATLRAEHPRLELRENAIPAALTRFPVPTVEVGAAPVVLPFVDGVDGWAAVDAHAAGSASEATLAAIVDTGAGTCVVDGETAERLGVRVVAEALPVIGIAGSRSSARAGVLRQLRFGSITANDVPISILPRSQLQELIGDVPFLIGWDILQHAAIEIAGKSRQLVVRRSELATPAAEPDLILLHEPVVRMTTGTESLLLLLDTGSAATEVRLSLAERLGWATRSTDERPVQGLGGEREGEVRMVESVPLRCGNVALTLGHVVAVPPPSRREPLRIDGTLGVDIAFAVRLVIDGPARTFELRTD